MSSPTLFGRKKCTLLLISKPYDHKSQHVQESIPIVTLPTDIIATEILPRLPALSLVRFKCVSKSFNTLISSSQFINLHLRHDTNRLLIVNKYDGGLHLFDLDTPESPPTYIRFPVTLTNNRRYYPVNIVGSCNGLLLLKFKESALRPLVLMNPCTGSYVHIPYHNSVKLSSPIFGFGFDFESDDYKLVAIVNSTFNVMVYSLRTNTWRFVESNMGLVHARTTSGVVINDCLLHWVFWSYSESKMVLCCFDICTETWIKSIPLPDTHDHSKVKIIDLGVLDGCLCLLVGERLNYTAVNEVRCLCFWVMKDYGVKESWINVLRVSHDASIGMPINVPPLAYRKGSRSEVLIYEIIIDENQLVWYNIEDERHTVAEVHDIHRFNYFYDTCVCKGSLINLPRGGKNPSATLYED